MKQIYLTLGLTFLLGAAALPMFSQVSNDNEDEVNKVDQRMAQDYVPGQVLVKMKDGSPAKVRRVKGKFQSAGLSKLDAVLNEFGVEDMEQLLPNAKVAAKARKAKAFNGMTIVERDLTQLYKLTLPEEKLPETMLLAERLKDLEEVEYAEPNYKLYIMDAEIAGSFLGNPFVSQQWYLDAYGVKQLWNKPIVNAKRPVIAIIDTGVDMTHPDLAPNLWTNTAEAEGEANYDNDGNGFKGDVHGWDFINNTPNVRDFNMHGTHVAGIAAAANNGIGIVGANPRALIMPISVMQSDGTGDVATIVKGINYAAQNGADVINMSLGSYVNSRAMRQALEKAYQTAVIVAAAGNDGLGIYTECGSPDYCPLFPAAYSFVLGVQATISSGSLAGFSNFDCDGPNYSARTSLQDPDGFNYELKAPGTNMLSTIPGGKYKVLQGTSMASPLVAGAISALKMVKNYDTQEILWGDLLHTDNIAQAYAVTARPAELDLMKIQLRTRKELADESEDDYSGDHEIDAGETVSLYPVIRTTYGGASNIKMHLEMGDEFEDPNTVQILTGADNKVDFGLHLDAYGKGVSLNPLKLKIADNVADGRHIKMKMVATCDESNVTYIGTFTLVVTNMIKINGLISENTTLTADHVYLVNENFGIMEGATLTIEPGARLEFMENMGLSSFGKLVAKGTPEKPITFTGYHGAMWAGIKSHQSTKGHSYNDVLYTNDAQTLFTLLPTDETPNQYSRQIKSIYYGAGEVNPDKGFYLASYIPDYTPDMTSKQHLLKDPNYLTSAVLQMLNDWETYCSLYPTQSSADKPQRASVSFNFFSWSIYDNPRDTISYCKIDGYRADKEIYHPYMMDCLISPYPYQTSLNFFNRIEGLRNTIMGTTKNVDASNLSNKLKYSNIVNNAFGVSNAGVLPTYSQLTYNNYFNNVANCGTSGKYYQKPYWLANSTLTPGVDKSNYPSYLGTSREDIVRPYIYEIGNAPDTYGQIDLSNMRTTPIPEAHGIVWKVVVNGKDAQDEYEDLAPLGVGKHKFEVYFNRPMNKAVAPQIAFGVRDPWTQNAVSEDGCWNEEGTIYTAYKTITGKTKSDGVNRIYVWGAEDDEYFEVPYEKTRFNVMINAAGSMATGFAAEAGLGKVTLEWDNSENNFDDAMGFNLYRYTVSETGNDTVRINESIVDIETTEYVDYDVTPGTTYYYLYKVLSTDLQEYDASNTVAVTPLTASLGDANGSGEVEVGDVVATVGKAIGESPKPFIFEAADVNSDQQIDVLDVVGIIDIILTPSAARTMSEGEGIYGIENGQLWVESDVPVAGLQVQLSTTEAPTATETLQGFELMNTWLSDNDCLVLSFNMAGKTVGTGRQTLLNVGDAQVVSLRLSDRQGHAIRVSAADDTTAIDRMGREVMTAKGIYNMSGQKMSNSSEGLRKGVYIINGEKVVK